MKISIFGYGRVGKSVKELFKDAIIHDPEKGFNNLKAAQKADVIFICVPTPNLADGKLDISMLEEVVKNCASGLICIRSTVMPGTTDMLKKRHRKRIVFQPEYLGETVNHPMTNSDQPAFIVFGGDPADRTVLIDLYSKVYNASVRIRQISAMEAEVSKISSNRAAAFKIAECQELFDVCERARVDYHTIREVVYGDDQRMNLWWTLVYPDKRGMNSKCIPKDVIGWCAWAESMGYKPVITQKILDQNKDWLKLNTKDTK
jgi:UDPglucose 6-dehydrogenase